MNDISEMLGRQQQLEPPWLLVVVFLLEVLSGEAELG
jgi:hypothetical protein